MVDAELPKTNQNLYLLIGCERWELGGCVGGWNWAMWFSLPTFHFVVEYLAE